MLYAPNPHKGEESDYDCTIVTAIIGLDFCHGKKTLAVEAVLREFVYMTTTASGYPVPLEWSYSLASFHMTCTVDEAAPFESDIYRTVIGDESMQYSRLMQIGHNANRPIVLGRDPWV